MKMTKYIILATLFASVLNGYAAILRLQVTETATLYSGLYAKSYAYTKWENMGPYTVNNTPFASSNSTTTEFYASNAYITQQVKSGTSAAQGVSADIAGDQLKLVGVPNQQNLYQLDLLLFNIVFDDIALRILDVSLNSAPNLFRLAVSNTPADYYEPLIDFGHTDTLGNYIRIQYGPVSNSHAEDLMYTSRSAGNFDIFNISTGVPTIVPEPASALLVFLGGSAMLFQRRRKA